MARIRSINPCAPKDEDVATLSIHARYVFAFLPCHADREGRLKDSAFTLKAEILPGDAVDMEAILAELAAARHIIRYTVDGRRFVQIRSFARHQSPHTREVSSMIPPPPAKAMSEHDLGSAEPPPGLAEFDTSGQPGLEGMSSSPSDPDPVPGSSPPLLSLRSDPEGARSNGQAKAITGHELRRIFGVIRCEHVGGLTWQTPNVAGGKDSAMAEVINADTMARADIAPTMNLLFKLAKDGKAGARSDLIVRDGSFAFGAWCAQWTSLREQVHGIALVATAKTDAPQYRKL